MGLCHYLCKHQRPAHGVRVVAAGSSNIDESVKEVHSGNLIQGQRCCRNDRPLQEVAAHRLLGQKNIIYIWYPPPLTII